MIAYDHIDAGASLAIIIVLAMLITFPIALSTYPFP
jgi:hypothetical protein